MSITSLLSSLDNTASLVPICVKDTIDNTGRTLMAYNHGGTHEAREKFIEETGTSILWLGGIPIFRWIFDKTVFKTLGLDPDIDLKKIFKEGPQQLKEIKEHGVLKPVSQIAKKYKNANIAKFAFSTLIPFFIITAVLPKFNQDLSKQIILDDAKKISKSGTKNNFKKSDKNYTNSKTKIYSEKLQDIERKFNSSPHRHKHSKKHKPGFGGASLYQKLLGLAAGSQINPVENLIFLDFGISANRVIFVARNHQERIEYTIKEAEIIFFFFFAAGLIKKGFENAAKALKTPISLDYKLLASDDLLKKMNDIYKNKFNKVELAKKFEKLTCFMEKGFKETKNLSELVKERYQGKGEKIMNWLFGVVSMKDTQFEKNTFKFIQENHKNTDFFTLQAAKKLGIIKTIGNNLNPKKYIEAHKIKELSKNIDEFTKAMLSSGLKPDAFIEKTKGIKKTAIISNLLLCNLALGFLLPCLQYFVREYIFGSKSYPGIKGYEKEASKILGN